MNNQDIKKLERIYHCLSIPGPAAGTQSASIKGFVSYSKDAKFAIGLTRKILYSIGGAEDYEGETEKLIEDFEGWLYERNGENWD